MKRIRRALGKWAQPLINRLVVSHVLVAILGLAVALGVSRVVFERYLVATELSTLNSRGQQIAHVMHGYFSGTLYASTAAYLVRVLQGTLADHVYVVNETGQILLTTGSSNLPVAPFPITVLRGVLINGKPYAGVLRNAHGVSVAASGIPVSVGGQVTGGVFVESPVSATSHMADSLTELLLLGEGIAVVLAALLAYAFGRQLVRPLGALRESVGQMGAGNTGARAPVEGPAEVASVAREFNRMAHRLDDQMEQLAREAQAREHLMAHVAHDLRTPLTSIRGFIEAIRDGVVDGPRRERALDVAWEETLRLQRLVDRLLAATRIRSGIGDRSVIEVDQWILAAIERIAPIAADHQVGVEWRQRDHAQIEGIADHLLEALINVLDNAVNWSPPNSTVWIDSILDADKGMVSVAVSDTGPGIADDLLPHMFERFVTGDPSRKASHGLGLAIVDDVTRQHGGTVAACNIERGGAKVVMTLPIVGEGSQPTA